MNNLNAVTPKTLSPPMRLRPSSVNAAAILALRKSKPSSKTYKKGKK